MNIGVGDEMTGVLDADTLGVICGMVIISPLHATDDIKITAVKIRRFIFVS
jgi:hypothetical protein